MMRKLPPMELTAYILFTLFCYAFTSSENQDYTVAKVCNGATVDEGKLGSDDLYYYNYLKTMYTNCNYVKGNIHIHPMPTLKNHSLDFFKSITEVSGYVRIEGQLPSTESKLPFSKLRIIRGESLTTYSDKGPRIYSLFLYNAASITNLGFTALREISKGSVYIGFNRRNCYGKNTNWADIFRDPRAQKTVIRIEETASCKSKSERCHPSCTLGCWGPGARDCQELNKVKAVCAEQCDYRCFGPGSNECCRPECAAGCSGPRDTDCWGCKAFYNNGTCTHECPRAKIYNQTTFSFVANPKAKVSFGKLCLPKCPKGYLEYREGCLIHKCPDGYEPVNETCVECKGRCPRVCDWTHLKSADTDWVTSSFLQKPKNHNCTVIAGNVDLLSGSFTMNERDKHLGERAVSAEDLKVFETVEEITGSLVFEPDEELPNVTSLDFFKNLKKIGGADNGGYSLIIDSIHLTSFGMTNLREVSTGNILFETRNMCYATDSTLRALFKKGSNKVAGITVRSSAECAAANRVCDAQCNSTCFGPGNTQCINCNPATESCSNLCKHFEFEGECVARCSENGLYANGTSCIRCHEQCDGTCKGPLDTDCGKCKNFKNGNRCVLECPKPTYADDEKVCRSCNETCNAEGQQFGCGGPKPIIGRDGCESCHRFLLPHGGGEIAKCLRSSTQCPDDYLTITQWKKLDERIKKSINDSDRFNEACEKCNKKCKTCDGKAEICTACSDIAYEEVPQDPRSSSWAISCRLTTDCNEKKYHRNDTTRKCIECNSECAGCTGPSDLECKICKGFKVELNGTKGFQCLEKCPPHLEHIWLTKNNERQCHDSAKPSTGKTGQPEQPVDAAAIAGSIAAVVVVIAVAAIVITYCCRQRRKHIEKSKEYELRLAAPGTVEPVMPSDANPDLSRLLLVKESELRKTVIIGSGAFGTVFKGYLIPDHENVKVPVAIKVLIEGTTPSQNTELLDEARVMASVDHPCCIKIIAVCMTSPMMLITPLMPAGCLLSYVKARAGQLGSKILINWCAQISKGMEHLQSCGIVHRDLAARNVLVQSETQVKITDFGLAKLLDAGEEYYKADSGKVPVKWMALESIQHRIFNHQTDVWSYGVTLWELLTFGQKPYDGVKARDIAILLERGERLNQPTISTIDVYMIMIKCWMLDANTRPTFEDLTKEFTKMARDPGRYLVIDGDQLKRNPTLKMNTDWRFDSMQDDDDEYPDKQLVGAEEYLSPSIASAYPRYENEDAIPPTFEKSLQQPGSIDNLHSPLRYTSSPTLRHFDPPDKLFVDTDPAGEDYLQPVSSRGAPARPAVDDDGYLQPQSSSGYIDVLADDRTNLPTMKKNPFRDTDGDEQSRQPLLGADNTEYLSRNGLEPSSLTSSNPKLTTPLLPDGTNPIYMSNNNGSPTIKEPVNHHNYQNIDRVNQAV